MSVYLADLLMSTACQQLRWKSATKMEILATGYRALEAQYESAILTVY